MASPSPAEVAAQLSTGQRTITDFPTTTADEWVAVSRLTFAQARPDLCQAIFKHVAKAEDLTYTAAKECMDYFRGTEQISMAVLVSERFKTIITRNTDGLLSSIVHNASNNKLASVANDEGTGAKMAKGACEQVGNGLNTQRTGTSAAASSKPTTTQQSEIQPRSTMTTTLGNDAPAIHNTSYGSSDTASHSASLQGQAATMNGRKGESSQHQAHVGIGVQPHSTAPVATPSQPSSAIDKSASSDPIVRERGTTGPQPLPGQQEILQAIERAQRFMRDNLDGSPTTGSGGVQPPTFPAKLVAGPASNASGSNGNQNANEKSYSGMASTSSSTRERPSSSSKGVPAMARRRRIWQEAGTTQQFKDVERFDSGNITGGKTTNQANVAPQTSANGSSRSATTTNASSPVNGHSDRGHLRRGEFPRLEVVVPESGRAALPPKDTGVGGDGYEEEEEEEESDEEDYEEEEPEEREEGSAAGDRRGTPGQIVSKRCAACVRAKQSCPQQQGMICWRHVRAVERANRQPCSVCTASGKVCVQTQGERCYFKQVKRESYAGPKKEKNAGQKKEKKTGQTCQKCRIAHRSCPQVYGEICPRASNGPSAAESSSRLPARGEDSARSSGASTSRGVHRSRSQRERTRDSEEYAGKAQESPSKRVRFD